MVTLFSCGSSSKKQRLVQRDHLVASKKFYCEFVNGEKYTDIDVALNIFMAEKCDGNRPFSITGYRSISDIPGVMFCCNIATTTATPTVLDLTQKASQSGRGEAARGDGKPASGSVTGAKDEEIKNSSGGSPESPESKDSAGKP
jgi:hypothetical protein